MTYMLLMYSDPDETKAMSAVERQTVRRRHEALHTEESGALLNGAGLAYPEDTTTLRLDNDAPVATEGPFVTSKQQLTAYYVIDCDTPEKATAIAERVLDFHVTKVELRPIHDWFGMDAIT
jgi:hypothetical protein